MQQSPVRFVIASCSSVVNLSSVVAPCVPPPKKELAWSLSSLPPLGHRHCWGCSSSADCKARHIIIVITRPILFSGPPTNLPAILQQQSQSSSLSSLLLPPPPLFPMADCCLLDRWGWTLSKLSLPFEQLLPLSSPQPPPPTTRIVEGGDGDRFGIDSALL